MNLSTTTTPLADIETELLAVGVAEGDVAPQLASLTAAFGPGLIDATTTDDFDGKVATWRSYPTFGHIKARRLVLVGTGDNSPNHLWRAAGRVGRICRKHGVAEATMHLQGIDANTMAAMATAVAEGNYKFDKYKETDRKAPLETLTMATDAPASAGAEASAFAAGQNLARDLVNEPAGAIYPETLAQTASALATDQMEVTVWDEARIRTEAMGGIIAVGQGSVRPPRFVHMHYRPKGTPRKKIALVGKGVTFDAGGLSLKPSSAMQTMRCDMAGSAAVVGAMKTISLLCPDVEVHGIFGAAENMVSGNSYKLGDVLKMYSGKTVEIHNTDAEGRLVLADCLAYASKLDVDAIVDLATLTGAIVVALGDDYSGLFTEDDELGAAIESAANEAQELIWRMPLPSSYKEKLKAEWADLKNVGGREGGAITAALFLKEFVDGKPWAHIDIAGPAFTDKTVRHLSAGGTGAMVRTMVEWARA